MSNKQKHLEFIQNVINRMARNSFFIRGWVITLVVGIFALSAARNGDTIFSVVLFVAAVLVLGAFWFLDGYFLDQERRFRGLYDEVRAKGEGDINFEMVTKPQGSWGKATFSKTLCLFYVPVALVTLVVLGILVWFSVCK